MAALFLIDFQATFSSSMNVRSERAHVVSRHHFQNVYRAGRMSGESALPNVACKGAYGLADSRRETTHTERCVHPTTLTPGWTVTLRAVGGA